MSDAIGHECGIAFIRLRKPLAYYTEKYGSPLYGISKLYLLMEKQRNRGQDGAGVAIVRPDALPGTLDIVRRRSVASDPIREIFTDIHASFQRIKKNFPGRFLDASFVKEQTAFAGEVLLGHLRYGTFGRNNLVNCHPVLRKSNRKSKSFALAGNFNMTNNEDLFGDLVDMGYHLRENIDTVTVSETIAHFLDEEHRRLFDLYGRGGVGTQEISSTIEQALDLRSVLGRACERFDGGYVMAGILGHGDAFVVRDPAGIRPAFYYADDEVVVAASEKPAIKTVFGVHYDAIAEIPPAHMLLVRKEGNCDVVTFTKPSEKRACSFERIYFSRGSDPDIYRERKMLGKLICPQVLSAVDHDLENTVFSYIPNTAETSFLGLMEALQEYSASAETPSKIRIEKLVIKDVKLRTFIADDEHREELVSHVYDTTYEIIEKGKDTLAVIDDSIVRGTTLQKSILTILDKLDPKRIVIISSAPQIRYPDCYGIDMSRLGDFAAFRALMDLIDKRGLKGLARDVYESCKNAVNSNKDAETNYVRLLYDRFTEEEISAKIAEIVRPESLRAELNVVFQKPENLQKACPNHLGDWYFTGNYPTPGGNRVANKAFMNFMEGVISRSY